MTYAWYGHLKDLRSKPLWLAIIVSWGVALFEYCFQVPANRFGHQIYTLPQLKVLQEVITMVVFSVFAVKYMGVPVSKNFIYATLCLIAAVYFIFRDGVNI
jgi:uncharacterized protein (DUF486 family)